MPEGQSFELDPEVTKAIVSGVVLGLVAAAVVWWLERFEARRMTRTLIGEVEGYLANHADFQDFLRRRGSE